MDKAIKQYKNISATYEWLKSQDSKVKVSWDKQDNEFKV